MLGSGYTYLINQRCSIAMSLQRKFLCLLLVVFCASPSYAQELMWVQTGSFSGVDTAFVHSLFINEEGNIVAGTLSGVFLSEDNGDTWEDISEGLLDDDISGIVEASDGTAYAGTHGGGMHRAGPTDEQWVPVNEGLENLDVGAVAITEDGTLFASTFLGGVYRSMDRGDTWSEVLNVGLDNPFIPSLLVEGSSIYAGTDDGVYRSTDNGDTWTQLKEGLGDPHVESLASSGDGVLFAGTDRGLYYTEDEGMSWLTPTANPVLSEELVRSLTVFNRFAVFAGTHDHGVFQTEDTGMSWMQMNMGLLNLDVHALAINPEGVVFAGTEGAGVFRTEMAINVSNQDEERIAQPTTFELQGNYPNPFNPQTTIRYALPEQAAVTMTIYDATGRRVAQLLQEHTQTAGRHEVTFDAAALPSGVYFYRLVAGDFNEVKQMILLK